MMGIYFINRVQMLRDVGHPQGRSFGRRTFAVTAHRGHVCLSMLDAGTRHLGKQNYVLSKFISGVS